MNSEAQSRAHDNLVEDRGGGIDDELAPARGSYNAMQVPGVHVGDGDAATLAQKVVSALQIAVAAPHRMSLPL
jgi:hypothetical protein